MFSKNLENPGFATVFIARCVVVLEEKILFLRPEQEKDKTHFTDKEVLSSSCEYIATFTMKIIIVIIFIHLSTYMLTVVLSLLESHCLLQIG